MNNTHRKRKHIITTIAIVFTIAMAVVFAWIFIQRWSPRQRAIDLALRTGESEIMVLASEVVVSRTGMSFSLQSRAIPNDDPTRMVAHIYGNNWELARWQRGRWRPVPYITPRLIPKAGLLHEHGATKEYHIDWSYIFGSLQDGRYLFIRRYDASEYVMIEFYISE